MIPMVIPPITPVVNIGMYDFVIIASGALTSNPITNPPNQDGKGNDVLKIKTPIANLLRKAPNIAIFFFSVESNLIGIINNTSIIPNITPAITP